MARVHVCAVDELPPGEARRVDCTPAVAVYNLDGAFHALADRCTHGDASMADGYLEDDGTVECPLHTARFCLKTGKPLCLPATDPLRVFPVTVEDGQIYVEADGE